jgi:hypothetical protein
MAPERVLMQLMDYIPRGTGPAEHPKLRWKDHLTYKAKERKERSMP